LTATSKTTTKKNNDKATTKPTTTTEEGERVNPSETIAAEDIVVPAMPPFHPRLPRHHTLL